MQVNLVPNPEYEILVHYACTDMANPSHVISW